MYGYTGNNKPVQYVSHTINVPAIKYSHYLSRGYNFLILKNYTFFKLLKILGMFPLDINDDGTVEFRWNSRTAINSMIGITIAMIVAFIDTYIVLSNMLTFPFTFEQSILYFFNMFYSLVEIMVITSFLEARKLAAYLNDWKAFQDKYENLTQEKLPVKENKLWIILLIGVMLFTGVVTYASIDMLFSMYDEHGLGKTGHSFFIIFYYYCNSMMLISTWLWFIFTSNIELTAKAVITNLERLQWIKRNELSEYVHLWIHLRRLCVNLGHVFSITYVYLCFMLFLCSLPLLYLGTYLLQQGQFSYLMVAGHCLLYFTFLAELSHRASEKVGRNFEERLTALLNSGNVAGQESKILEFTKTVVGLLPTISLGGFFQFDRGINAPLYSAVITYFIIILQFKNDEPEHCLVAEDVCRKIHNWNCLQNSPL